jgi:hypothetical protein
MCTIMTAIGQALWLREEQVMQQVREMKSVSHAGE